VRAAHGAKRPVACGARGGERAALSRGVNGTGSGVVMHGGLVREEGGGRMGRLGKEENGTGPRGRYFFYLIEFQNGLN
jgi:hypothetical protein